MTYDQKKQVDDLINSIRKTLHEDFVYKTPEEVEETCSYLKERIQKIQIDKYTFDF